MGDPVTMIMIGSAVMGAASSIQQGNAQAAAAEFERVQYEDQRKMAEIQGLDEESDRRRRLSQVLSSNQAAAAGMGISTDGSRSFLAIQKDSAREAERDIGRIRLNAKSASNSARLSADQAKLTGKTARKSGYIGAGQSLLEGGYKYSQLQRA
jgi:hypothetical protein